MNRVTLCILLVFFLFTINSVYALDDWWNASWHYRVKVDINTTDYERLDWPMEYTVNFTKVLEESGNVGNVDLNSTRVFEYDDQGKIKFEVISQFDQDDAFNASNNALGIVAFIMNGTTYANEKRSYYIYFDTTEKGNKTQPVYQTDLKYDVNSYQFHVNNTFMAWYVDTNRSDNTSGLVRVIGLTANINIFNIPQNQKSAEYIQYMNNTYNFTFNFRENITFKHIGPVRIVVEQKGNETLVNNTDVITEGFMTKRYVFYSNNKWIKVEQVYTNLGNSTISRRSTPAGALALDYLRAFFTSPNTVGSRPDNMRYAGYAGVITAYIHVNQTGTTNFGIKNTSFDNRIGIHLNNTNISSGSSISETAALYFNDTETDLFGAAELTDRLINPAYVQPSAGESILITTDAQSDFDIYNLGETFVISGNNTYDPYNFTLFMNATINKGTEDTNDDNTIILYNDGTHNDTTANDTLFTNIFNTYGYDVHGLWNITVKSYNNESVFLNQSTKTINVTNIYNVTIYIFEPVAYVRDAVNSTIYVRNFRKDIWISNANISCRIGTELVSNQTVDYSNGTYFLQFDAPSAYGQYALNCTATKLNNTGNYIEPFIAENTLTNMTIYAEPYNYTATNITLSVNESFSVFSNTTNIGGGTAYANNITLTLPQGWTANATTDNCGNVLFGLNCSKGFDITIGNGTPSGNYLVNVTSLWRNPDRSIYFNMTSINVTVLSNVILNVTENQISGIVPGGSERAVGSFVVRSLGNDGIQNISFNVSSFGNFTFTFSPTNISFLPAGYAQRVYLNVSVPNGFTPNTYNGTINVTSGNDGFDEIGLVINVPGSNMTMELSLLDFTTENISSTVSENFTVFGNTTNVGNNIAYYTNITVTLPQNWTTNASVFSCGNISVDNSCWSGFNIRIPNTTLSGSYLVNISSVWHEPEVGTHSNSTSINVTVLSNITMLIVENFINATAVHGNRTITGNFTIRSLGNDPLNNITYTFYDFSNLTFTVNPNTTRLFSGFNKLISVNVSVPYGYSPGNYSGYLIVNTSSGNYKNISVNIRIPETYSWFATPMNCTHLEMPESGTVCDVTVNNTGNVVIDFNITPDAANYTWVDTTNFTIQPTETYTFSVLYDLVGIDKTYYNITYLIDALNDSAEPDTTLIFIYLNPRIFPIVYLSLAQNPIHQGGNTIIYANITDQSTRGIHFATARVTSPNGAIYTINMTRLWNDSINSSWAINYPNSWGSTAVRGNYTVFVFAVDNSGNNDNATSFLIVYPNMSVILDTGSHYQGQTGTYYFNVHDANSDPIPFSNVSVVMKNSNNNITLNKSFVTDSTGEVPESDRQFTISSDATTGTYSLYSNASWYDTFSGRLINSSRQMNFSVYETLGGGLSTDVQTAVVWYPNNVMKFSVTVYNDQGQAIDPDTMNLTVYDAADNDYFAIDMSSMTKNDRGFYTYDFSMPLNTSTGAFRVVVVATKGSFLSRNVKPFRVATGGPYDVRVELLQNEVPLGGYLDFTAIIENKGEVSQDVDLEYWVTDDNNTVWKYTSEAVLVNAFSNQSFLRKAFIFNNQNLGKHYLNIRVTYDLIQQPIRKNTTFFVIPAVTSTIPPGAAGPSAGAPSEEAISPPFEEGEKEKTSKLTIIQFPSELGIESGWAKYPTIKVKNTGESVLNNIHLLIRGISLAWFTIEPENIESLKPNEIGLFSLKIAVPQSEKTNEYLFKINAVANETSDEAVGTIFIFESREELMYYELGKVKKNFNDLVNNTETAKKDGLDISSVITLINESRVLIDQAEDLIKNKDFDNSLDRIISASNLIDRANQLLLKSPRAKPMVLPGLPLSTFLIVMVILILSTAIVFFMVKLKILDFSKIFKKPGMPEAEGVAEVLKKESAEKESLTAEKDKINRILTLLDSELKEGIISKEAHEELKKRNVDKLEEIENKLAKTK